MKRCSNCGASIDDNSTACAICGVSTNEEDFYSIYGIPKPSSAKNKPSNTEENKTDDINNGEHIDEKIDDVKVKINDNKNRNVNEESKQKNEKSVKENEESEQENEGSIKNADNVIPINAGIKTQDFKAVQQNNEDKAETHESAKTESKNTDNAPNLQNAENTTKQATLNKIKNDNNDTAEIKIHNESINDEFEMQEIEYSEVNDDESFVKKVMLLLSPVKKLFFATKDETEKYNKTDIEENCHFALISYLMYFFFVPMIVKPYSEYLRFHGNQGLNLVLFSTGLEIVNVIINCIIGAVCTVDGVLNNVGVILTVIITMLINIVILIWIAIGIANAVKGKARELPVIGKFRILK